MGIWGKIGKGGKGIGYTVDKVYRDLFKNSKIQGFKDSRIQGFKDLTI
jgi:predicted glycosyl hydrolase (DUF1957 family)